MMAVASPAGFEPALPPSWANPHRAPATLDPLIARATRISDLVNLFGGPQGSGWIAFLQSCGDARPVIEARSGAVAVAPDFGRSVPGLMGAAL